MKQINEIRALLDQAIRFCNDPDCECNGLHQDPTVLKDVLTAILDKLFALGAR